MTVQNAKSELLSRINEYAEKFSALGLITETRVYYTDKSLREHEQLCRGIETLWCELSVRCENIESEDALLYSFFRDIERDGETVKEADIQADSETAEALDELYGALSSADEPIARFMEEYERTCAEFNAQMEAFEKKLQKIRRLSYIATGIVVLMIAVIFILSLF